MYVLCGCAGYAREHGKGQRLYKSSCCGPDLPSPPLEILRASLCPPLGVVLHCWVGLSWVPIVGPADPILRVETAFREFHLATSTEIGSCRFPSGLLTFAGTAVLHMLSSSSH